jgi:hypothetical protein
MRLEARRDLTYFGMFLLLAIVVGVFSGFLSAELASRPDR